MKQVGWIPRTHHSNHQQRNGGWRQPAHHGLRRRLRGGGGAPARVKRRALIPKIVLFQHLTPACTKADPFWGFPNRLKPESNWRTEEVRHRCSDRFARGFQVRSYQLALVGTHPLTFPALSQDLDLAPIKEIPAQGRESAVSHGQPKLVSVAGAGEDSEGRRSDASASGAGGDL